LLYFSVLSEESLNQKMLLYRRGLNVARERLRLPDTRYCIIKVMEIEFISSANKVTHSEKPAWSSVVRDSVSVIMQCLGFVRDTGAI